MRLDEQTLEVGNLGRFSMRAIYDALAHSEHATTSQINSHGSCPYARRSSAQSDDRHFADDTAEDSDCSWTQDEDSGTVYFDIRRQLDAFVASETQTNMTTTFLTKQQRRFVHATAQIMRLGHASLGPSSKHRQMIIYKSAPSVALDSIPSGKELSSSLNVLQSIQPFVSRPSVKRRRLERVENGFRCDSPGCSKIFDRASERTKHAQVHQTAYTNRYQCPSCGKGFRYPKDVRRHYKIHDKAAPSQPMLSSSFGSNGLESTLTSDSRVPSDTSLTFSSNTASKDVSPLIPPQYGGDAQGLDMEPLVLGDQAWSGAAMNDVDDWLLDPYSGYGNVDDEDFLEMARVRK